MRRILSLAVIALAAGCGSAATTSTASTPPPSATVAIPAGCAAALAALPAVPATAQQAAGDVAALGGRKGTTLGALLDKVAADASAIGLALDTGSGNVASGVAAFRADEAAVRSYCA